jgi:hypothetical protein
VNEVERLQRRLEREKQARKSAELIAETKTREIYEATLRLQASMSISRNSFSNARRSSPRRMMTPSKPTRRNPLSSPA